MSSRFSTDRIVGCLAIVAAGLVCFVWVPLDTATGLIEKVRRQVAIGDSLAPVVAATFIGLGGMLCLMTNLQDSSGSANRRLRYLCVLSAILAVSLAVMRWSGPLVVDLAGLAGPEQTYRLLRDTAPWKYLGFALGGLIMTLSLMRYAGHRLSVVSVLSAIIAILVIIGLYDLPFDDLLLPPNGDV